MNPILSPSPRAAARALTRGFNDLGFGLHRRLPRNQNSFFSPLSIGSALAALLPGARGATAAEVAGLLGVTASSPDEIRAGSAELHERLAPRSVGEETWDDVTGDVRTVERESFRLSLATALFVLEAYPLVTEYCDALSDAFAADFFSVDFNDNEAAAARINGWVEAKTEGRIRELIDPDALSATTRLVLANAVYFKARWAGEFQAGGTRPGPFHLLGGEQVLVPMMRQERFHRHWRDGAGAAEALRIPYEQDLSMLVVLPAAGHFADVEDRLSTGLLQEIDRGSEDRLVALELPRFELRYESKLAELLQDLGMERAFDRRRADFSGITPAPEGLVLSQVVHQAWVRVDEHGTEAAAATAVIAVAGSAEDIEPPQPTPFIVDRPFFFFIRDDRTGATLFLGRVMDPRG